MGYRLLVLVLVIGCGNPAPVASPRAEPGPTCKSREPLGTIDDFVRPERSGFEVAKPRSCGKGEGYIRIERTIGTRSLGTGQGTGGGFDQGCTSLPADPSDQAACPVINPAAILMAAYTELEHRHIEVNGVGLGPCGDVNGPYATWNMAAMVTDWKHATTLVLVISDLLERYDVAGFVGAGVRGVPCVIPL